MVSIQGNKTCEPIPHGAITEFLALQRARGHLLTLLHGFTGQPVPDTVYMAVVCSTQAATQDVVLSQSRQPKTQAVINGQERFVFADSFQQNTPTIAKVLHLDSVYFQCQRKLAVVKKEALDATAASQEMRRPKSS